jgi:alanine dehydrogenase
MIANQGFDAARTDPALAKGVNVYKAQVTYEAVAEAFGMPFTPLDQIL